MSLVTIRMFVALYLNLLPRRSVFNYKMRVSPSILIIGLVIPINVLAINNPPFSEGESFTITRGYNRSPTHIDAEKYALDFTQSGCNAYKKPALAAEEGEIIKVNNKDAWAGGFGYFVRLQHPDGTQSRYAHLAATENIKRSVVAKEILGYIGNTGNVSGSSC